MLTRAILLIALSAIAAFAVPLTPVPPTGQRAADADLFATGLWEGDFQIAWEVAQVGQLFEYQYTFTSASKSISHWLLELSGNCWTGASAASSPCVMNPALNGDSFGGLEFKNHLASQGNPGLPNDIWGVKIEASGEFSGGPLVYAFTSERRPMWGSIFVKGGGVTAYNRGLASPSSADVNFFLAVPDTLTVAETPEPATVVLMGAALLVLGFARRRSSPDISPPDGVSTR